MIFINETITRFITASIIGTLFWCVFFYLPPIAFSLLLFYILLMILFTELKNLFKPSEFWFWFIMPWYPILPFLLLIYMNQDPCYRNLVYHLFVIVFAFDGTAYVTGTTLGFHKIVPSISHGKTLEGCIGGLIGAWITFYFVMITDHLNLSWSFFSLFVFIVCVIAFAGDIFESFLKRKAKIKDAGYILPGHGGFLDRFDAVIAATFFFFFFRHELAKLLCP